MELFINNKIIESLRPDENGITLLKSNNILIGNNLEISKLSKVIDFLGNLSAKVIFIFLILYYY